MKLFFTDVNCAEDTEPQSLSMRRHTLRLREHAQFVQDVFHDLGLLLYTLCLKKRHPFCFCNNLVECQPTIHFGTVPRLMCVPIYTTLAKMNCQIVYS